MIFSKIRGPVNMRSRSRFIVAAVTIFVMVVSIGVGWMTAESRMLAIYLISVPLFLVATLWVVSEKPNAVLLILIFAAFLVPLEVSASESVDINSVILILPLLCGLWIIRSLLTGDGVTIDKPTMRPMLVFLIIAGISWLYGLAAWQSIFPKPDNLLFIQFGQWAIFALSFLGYFLAAQQSITGIRWFIWAFLIFSALILIGRYGGPLGFIPRALVSPVAQGNGVIYVWFTAIAGSQALFNSQLSKSLRRILIIAAISVPLFGFVFNSNWATSWLPPLVVLLSLIFFRSRRTAIALLVALVMVALLFSGILLSIFDWNLEKQYSIGGRFILWEAVLRLAVKEPILGLGLTTYHQYYKHIPLLTDVGAWYRPNVNSHNLYVDIFAQMGAVGLVVFAWLIIEIGRLLLKSFRVFESGFEKAFVVGCIAGGIGILAASVMVEWLLPFVYNVGFKGLRFTVFNWIFLGGLVAIWKLRSESKNEPKRMRSNEAAESTDLS